MTATTIISTNERTLNQNVVEFIKNNVTGLDKLVKKHVAGMGYVFYLKNVKGENLGYVYKEQGQMKVQLKNN